MPTLREQLNNIVSPLVLEDGWKVVGNHPVTNEPIFEEMRPFFTNEPVLDKAGEQVWKRHPQNGENSYRARRLVREDRPQRFTRVDPGNGNVRKEPYVEPSPQELRERDIQARKHDLMAGLVHAMAEKNVTPEQLVNAVLGATPQPEDQPGDDAVFPRHVGGNNWLLSDENKFRGSRVEAEAAQAALREAASF